MGIDALPRSSSILYLATSALPHLPPLRCTLSRCGAIRLSATHLAWKMPTKASGRLRALCIALASLLCRSPASASHSASPAAPLSVYCCRAACCRLLRRRARLTAAHHAHSACAPHRLSAAGELHWWRRGRSAQWRRWARGENNAKAGARAATAKQISMPHSAKAVNYLIYCNTILRALTSPTPAI